MSRLLARHAIHEAWGVEGGTLAVRVYRGETVGSLPFGTVAARIQAANVSRGSF